MKINFRPLSLHILHFNRCYYQILWRYLLSYLVKSNAHDVMVDLKNFIMNLSLKIALWSTVKMNKLPKSKTFSKTYKPRKIQISKAALAKLFQ